MIKACIVCLKRNKQKYTPCYDNNNEVGYICKDCISNGNINKYGLKKASYFALLIQKIKDYMESK